MRSPDAGTEAMGGAAVMVSVIPDLKHRSVRESVSEAEWHTRVHLAAAFRTAHGLGWNDGINNHITARLPGEPAQFLINGRGIGWHEVTASSLNKVDLDGNILDQPDFPASRAGLNFHAAVLRAKPHVNCILHVHPMTGVVISAMEEGLLIADQSACMLHGGVSYHPFEGYADDADEGRRIAEELGDTHAMIMWNHGLLTAGRTIGEAFCYMRRIMEACELQERLMATGAKIRRISRSTLDHVQDQLKDRRGNEPYGALEWGMLLRVAKERDPTFER